MLAGALAGRGGASSEAPAGSAVVALRTQIADTSPDSAFRHASHRDVNCTVCHSMEDTHGRVTVTGITECRSCHHAQPVAAQCSRCHPAAGPSDSYRETRTVRFSVPGPVSRTLPFQHAPHTRVECGRCHTGGLTLSAATASCEGCHTDHHGADANCIGCHQDPPAGAHNANAHVTCTGAGCHTPPPFRPIPRTRPLCLACHQDLTDHRPGRNCADCHALPTARATGDAPDEP
jgi:hypothetical protein